MSSVVPLLLTSALALSSIEAHDIFRRGCDETATPGCGRHHENHPESNVGSPFTGPPPPASGITSCIPNDAGGFGSDAGEQEEINFFYQVETFPGVQLAEMNNNILGDVEREISMILLPAIFPENCGDSAGRRRQRQLAVTGVSTLQPDVVLVGVICEGEMQDYDNVCFVVDGSVTVFVQEETNTDQLAETVRGTIRDAMDHGFLDKANEQIVNVTFRDGTDVQSLTRSTENLEEKGESSGSGKTDLSWLWALIATIGALLLAWLGLSQLRRRTIKKKQEAMPANAIAEEDTPISDENGDAPISDKNGDA